MMKLMVIGFPKSGTTSITAALELAGVRCAHWRYDANNFVGELIYRSLLAGDDPFASLGEFEAITQADACVPALNVNVWPNLDFSALIAIRRAHPTCHFLLNYRRPEAICESIEKWPNLQSRLTASNIPGLPRGFGGERGHLRTWIENHFDACRTFFAKDEHFSEIDIESPDAPERLGSAIGVPITRWANVKPLEPPPTAAARA